MKNRNFIQTFLLLLTYCVLVVSKVNAQTCTGNHITVSMKNFSSTFNSFEFDIYLKNDGVNQMNFASLAGGFTYPVGFIPAGCNLSGTCIEQPNTIGNFPNFTNISAINHNVATRQMRWTNNPPMSSNTAVPLPLGVDLKFARLRFTLSSGCVWPSCYPLNLTWNYGPLPNQFTEVQPLIYCNGNPNSAVLSLGELTCINPQNITINCGNCPTSINTIVAPTCFGDTTASMQVSLTSTTSTTGTYSLNGGVSIPYSTNPFSISGLNAGTQTLVVISDTGCAPLSTQFNIAFPAVPFTDTTTITSCNNYSWPITGQTYSTSGLYSGFSSNSQGCTVIEILNLTITPNLVNVTKDTSCGPYTWTANNTTYPTSGNYSIINGCNIDSLYLSIQPYTTTTTFLTAYGYYTWPKNGVTYIHNGTYVSNKPCSSDTLKLIVVPNSLTESTELSSSYKLKPNPTRDFSIIEFNSFTSSVVEISVFDLTGRCIKKINSNCKAGLNLIRLDLSDLAQNIYTLRISEQDKISQSIQIQKID